MSTFKFYSRIALLFFAEIIHKFEMILDRVAHKDVSDEVLVAEMQRRGWKV